MICRIIDSRALEKRVLFFHYITCAEIARIRQTRKNRRERPFTAVFLMTQRRMLNPSTGTKFLAPSVQPARPTATILMLCGVLALPVRI